MHPYSLKIIFLNAALQPRGGIKVFCFYPFKEIASLTEYLHEHPGEISSTIIIELNAASSRQEQRIMRDIAALTGGRLVIKPETENACRLLSLRQKQVLPLLCSGKKYKTIGRLLHVSINTIRTHVMDIYHILKVKNRLQCRIKAQKRGWI